MTIDKTKAKKNELRAQALAKRDQLNSQWRTQIAMQLADDFKQPEISSLFKSAQIVSGFLPIRSEIDLRPLMAKIRENGMRLCVPVLLDKTTMVMRELIPGAPMIDMGFGTIGPDENAPVIQPDVLLMPLAAFDQTGNRIGYGAGFYDRYIEKLRRTKPDVRLIATAFECQRVESVPFETHDIPLHALWSENGLQNFPLPDVKI